MRQPLPNLQIKQNHKNLSLGSRPSSLKSYRLFHMFDVTKWDFYVATNRSQ